MRCLWEEKDITAGRRFGKVGVDNAAGLIGYTLPPNGNKVYTLIALCDGLAFYSSDLRSEIAAALNQGDYLPAELLKG